MISVMFATISYTNTLNLLYWYDNHKCKTFSDMIISYNLTMFKFVGRNFMNIERKLVQIDM